MKRITSSLLALVLTVSIVAVGTVPASAASSSESQAFSQMRDVVLQDAVENSQEASFDPDETVELIVELKSASGLELTADGDAERAAANKTLLRRVQSTQDSCIQAIRKLDKTAEISHRYTLLVNGFSVRTKFSNKAKIEKLAGVSSVVVANRYERAVTETGVLGAAISTAQRSKYDGRGTVVAVIDSGIDYQHKDMVLSPGISGKLSAADISALKSANSHLKGRYFTAKVPYGYNYADQNNNVIDTAVEDSAYNHGMHVAGIIGANCQSQEEIDKYLGVRGVAPECQLLAMKIFSNIPNVNASEADIIAAIEDSVALGADVINLSIGMSSGFHNSENGQQKAIKAAREAGVIVVAAAGNGAVAPYQQASDTTYHPNYSKVIDTGTIAEPGLADDAIQVASMDNTHRVVWQLNTWFEDQKLDPLPFIFSDFDASTLTGRYPVVYCRLGTAEDMNGLDLTGKIALIQRGEIEFAEKKMNAQEHGAVAAIIYNSDGLDSFVDYTSTDDDLTIPTMFMRYSDGAALQRLTPIDVNVSFDGDPIALEVDSASTISYYSSYGPVSDLSFKPDVTAVGGYVWSTIGGNGYETMSGTSMACPNVAGMAALMVQQLNEAKRSVADPAGYVKTALMNTATILRDSSGHTYSPRAQGSGAANLRAALNSTVTATVNGKPYLELKEINEERSFTVQLHNYGTEAVSYRVSSTGAAFCRMTFSESRVTVAPGETAEVTVTIRPGGITDSFVEGYLWFTPTNLYGYSSLHIPFMGFYGDWSAMQILDDPYYEEETTVYGVTGLYTLVNLGQVSQIVPLGDGESPDYYAFNPSDSDSYNNIMPEVSFLRNARNVTVDVSDESGSILRVVNQTDYVRKEVPIEQSILAEFTTDWLWYGTYYDKATGSNVSLPEGQYYMNIRAYADTEDAEEQVLTMPVKIDMTAPTVTAKALSDSSRFLQLTITAKDFGVVDSGIKSFVFLVDGEPYRDEDGNAVFELEEIMKDSGLYQMNIAVPEENTNSFHVVDIGVTDHANNMGATRVLTFSSRSTSLLVSSDKSSYAPGEDIGLHCSWKNPTLEAKAVKYHVYTGSLDRLLGELNGPDGSVSAMLTVGRWQLLVLALDKDGNILDINSIIVVIDGKEVSDGLFLTQQTSSDTLENGRAFTADLRVANLNTTGVETALILALYDSEMRMVDFAAVERKVSAGKAELLSATVTVPELGRYSAKIMVWNNLTDMQSLLPLTLVR